MKTTGTRILANDENVLLFTVLLLLGTRGELPGGVRQTQNTDASRFCCIITQRHEFTADSRIYAWVMG